MEAAEEGDVTMMEVPQSCLVSRDDQTFAGTGKRCHTAQAQYDRLGAEVNLGTCERTTTDEIVPLCVLR